WWQDCSTSATCRTTSGSEYCSACAAKAIGPQHAGVHCNLRRVLPDAGCLH
ncbi:casA, partial [Symbiodinium sp. KB8]